MAGLRASGPAGCLRVGYQWAADLGAWTLEPDADHCGAFRLVAALRRTHAYWFDQAPIDLVLTLGNTEWIWRGVEVERGPQGVSVVLAERPIVSDRMPVLE